MDRKRSDILKYEKKMPVGIVEGVKTQRAKIWMGDMKQDRQPRIKISRKDLRM